MVFNIYIFHKQLEATWILINLSFGNEKAINEITNDKYQFLKSLNLFLEGKDIELIDLVIHLFSNIAGTDIKSKLAIIE